MKVASYSVRHYGIKEVVLLVVLLALLVVTGWYIRTASNNAYNTYNSAPSSVLTPHKATTKH